RNALAGGAIGLAAILLFIGIAAISLAASGGSNAFAGIISDPYILRVLRFTLLQAVLSTLLSVLLALPVARALARQPNFP
ncbi:hypothetical protein, partial [Chryseobacterium sp. SIMBA_029]|uniref:hypothetical protein n=1 Tax=Chryseobacterium sp. SIMBA_029 TaxID=3085772 RepID=UPI00397AB1CF